MFVLEPDKGLWVCLSFHCFLSLIEQEYETEVEMLPRYLYAGSVPTQGQQVHVNVVRQRCASKDCTVLRNVPTVQYIIQRQQHTQHIDIVRLTTMSTMMSTMQCLAERYKEINSGILH